MRKSKQLNKTKNHRKNIGLFSGLFSDVLTDIVESLIQNSIRQVLSEQTTETKPPADEILSTEQASKYLNLAVQTIYGFTSKNEIPFFKRGKKLYFKKSELEQWLLEGKQKTLKETQKDAIDYINKKKK